MTVTIPEELFASIRERVGERELSSYVTDALAHQDRIDRLGELSDWLQEEHGAVTDEEPAEARPQVRPGHRDIGGADAVAQADRSPSNGCSRPPRRTRTRPVTLTGWSRSTVTAVACPSAQRRARKAPS
ncbi:hypothetical protein [Streptomyces sp. NRRL F-5123]|uniref:hypothetical protein n=1 Tax=Streptomyces sp. NRRL F-5123 TaxID=1463856 RepID=UPI0018FF1136|nr:hypothetical protein [Streptomyces sp. NRRL F-5123]